MAIPTDLTLALAINPKDISTAQQKGATIIAGRVHFFIKGKVAQSSRRISTAVLAALKAKGIPTVIRQYRKRNRIITREEVRDTIPKNQAVRLDIVYRFPFQQSARNHSPNEWMLERPDLDNLTKSVQDCLTDVKLWADDSQVAIVSLSKHRTTDTPEVRIRIRQLEDKPTVEW